ncbi:MAG: hypothetical protein F4210_04435 [Holophagales bacterium]|nr:hypothetical protein [Holophagales bacterium]MYF94752.1 hypothetical protein [Holophagales bacterium]
MTNGPTKLWMGVALGSVLVVGVSAGLVADRLLPEPRAASEKREAPAQARASRSSSMFHFDCRDREEDSAEASSSSAPEEPTDAARSEAGDEYRAKVTHRMARRLDLDPEQVAALEPIVGEAMVRGRLYWTGAREEFCAMQKDFHRQVGELLRPDQAVRFDEMQKELWERSRRHEDRRDHDGRGRGRHGDGDSPGECQ